jgi:hypothetical protein
MPFSIEITRSSLSPRVLKCFVSEVRVYDNATYSYKQVEHAEQISISLSDFLEMTTLTSVNGDSNSQIRILKTKRVV